MLRKPQLLADFRAGKKSAYLALYERYATRLRRFLQSGFSFSSQGRLFRFKGVDPQMDAESIVQETFTRAFSAATRRNYDGVRPFQTYLFSIAKNLVLKECHHRDRLISSDTIDESNETQSIYTVNQDPNESNPEKKTANKQLGNITMGFIASLSSEERDFFTRRFTEGLTQEGTAAKMKTTRARIKLLEKVVRKRFIELLRENGYFVDYNPSPRWKRKEQKEDVRAFG